jgi:membrane protein required for colicin V production
MSLWEGIHWLRLTGVDYALLGLVFFSLLLGAYRGFSREAIALASWVGGLFLAFHYAHAAGSMFTFITSKSGRYGTAFALILLSVLIIGWLLNRLVRLFLRGTGLTVMDRGLGVVFGVGRGVLLCAALLLMVQSLQLPMAKIKKAQLTAPLMPLALWLKKLTPTESDSKMLASDEKHEVA